MAKKSKKKQNTGAEFYENPEVLASQLSKTEEFLHKNKKLVFSIGGVIALAIVAIFGYRYYVSNQNDKAQGEMFQAVYYFEQDSLNLALNGNGNYYGFLDIMDKFGMSKAANLSHYYAGAIYMKQGKYDEAVEQLKDFSSDDLLIQARAYALMGDAYMQLGNYADAGSMYEKAASYKPNQWFSPIYWNKAALAYEKNTNTEKAINCYQKIVDKFKDSRLYPDAQKQLARLQALAKK